MEEYFERTKDFWIEQSKKYFENEEMRVTTRTVTKFAKEMCAEYVKRWTEFWEYGGNFWCNRVLCYLWVCL